MERGLPPVVASVSLYDRSFGGGVAFTFFKSRTAQVENLALRHQLGVPYRSVKKPKLTAPDRLLWAAAA